MAMEIPESLIADSLKILEVARNTGKVRRGTNESTKAIERNKAKIVYIAKDVQPPEIVAHLPILCDEKKIPYIYVSTKMELGKASGIDVPSASVSILDPGKADKQLSQLLEKLEALKKGKAPKEEPAKKKPEGKKEKKPAEKPPEKKEGVGKEGKAAEKEESHLEKEPTKK